METAIQATRAITTTVVPTVEPLEVRRTASTEGHLNIRRTMPLSEIKMAERILSGLSWRPTFGIVLGIGEAEAEVAAARRSLEGLRRQAYKNWRVTIVRRGRILPENCARRILDGFAEIDDRVDLCLDAPVTAEIATLVAAPQGGVPDLIGVLLGGDVLGCDALLEMAVASGLRADAELLYSDEIRISPVTGQKGPFLKPQWSPDLLTTTNYIGRFWCALSTVLRESRATLGEYIRFGDYDLILRCTEVCSGVVHVAKVLCALGRKKLDHPDQELAALRRAADRRKIDCEVEQGSIEGYYRLKRAVPSAGLVSIVIPTCAAKGLIATCITSIKERTRYRNFEIICVENISAGPGSEYKKWLAEEVGIVISAPGQFNWSRFNNLGAAAAKGEFLLFLNDDIEIIDPHWLDALLEHLGRQEVGVVGARLLYPDRRVQHAGIFWTPNGGRHAFRNAAENDPGYFGLAVSERNVLAVTGACFAVRRSNFERNGGFDESHTIVNNDVDYCLRCWEQEQSVVYTPHATLIHHEGASRRSLEDKFDVTKFFQKWGSKLLQGDPYYHALLSRNDDNYQCDFEPLEYVYPSHPLFDAKEIRDILVVKLDHLGDFVTSFPAINKLRDVFPAANIHLLTTPRNAVLSGLLPDLASITEFEFFSVRSDQGARELSSADYSNLMKTLEPHRFDLAVDFRKWPETRPILQLTGARWFAGFDRDRQFPWLDVVVEWEQDRSVVRKQHHVSEDLLRLVDAIAIAARGQEIDIIHATAPGRSLCRGDDALRLVCVHPGVGSRIRQWPSEYFALLINLLLAAHDLEIVLIGTSDEATIAEAIIEGVQRRESVRSLVGQVPLADLPAFLAGAALFVGNNSGPKHLAAALGVPTVGIHSGTVDAREWGPVGANGIAVRRDMVCSPCYLSEPDHCPRELACLTELRAYEVYEVCNRLLAIDHSG